MNHSAYISAVPYKHKDSTEMKFSPGTEIMGVHTDPQTCHRRQDKVLGDHTRTVLIVCQQLVVFQPHMLMISHQIGFMHHPLQSVLSEKKKKKLSHTWNSNTQTTVNARRQFQYFINAQVIYWSS